LLYVTERAKLYNEQISKNHLTNKINMLNIYQSITLIV
jgi:hypothetical protein